MNYSRVQYELFTSLLFTSSIVINVNNDDRVPGTTLRGHLLPLYNGHSPNLKYNRLTVKPGIPPGIILPVQLARSLNRAHSFVNGHDALPRGLTTSRETRS